MPGRNAQLLANSNAKTYLKMVAELDCGCTLGGAIVLWLWHPQKNVSLQNATWDPLKERNAQKDSMVTNTPTEGSSYV